MLDSAEPINEVKKLFNQMEVVGCIVTTRHNKEKTLLSIQ